MEGYYVDEENISISDYSSGIQNLLNKGGNGLKIRSEKLELTGKKFMPGDFGEVKMAPALKRRDEKFSLYRGLLGDEDEELLSPPRTISRTRVPENTIPMNRTIAENDSEDEDSEPSTPSRTKSKSKSSKTTRIAKELPDIDVDRLVPKKTPTRSKDDDKKPYTIIELKKIASKLGIVSNNRSKQELVNDIKSFYL